jgi:putative Mg2+ transporter-C (MgtC) family protein
MIVSAFGFTDILGAHNVVLDPSRIAAQVVSGIGFLGAGAILLRKEIIKGLTTAAAIWVVSAIGLACGAGLLLEAFIVTLFTIAVLTLLQPLRQRVRRTPDAYHLRIKVTAVNALLGRVYDTCIEAGATLEQVEIQTGNERDKLEISCMTGEVVQLTKSLMMLRTVPGMDTISINLRNPNNELLPLVPFFKTDAEEQATESIA